MSQPLSPEHERDLLHRLRAGGSAGDAAFQELYEALKSPVLSVCQRIAGREAEDAFQEVFVAVHKGLPRFRAEARLFTWVYRIAIRVALRAKARARRGQGASLQQEPAAQAQPDPVVEREDRANVQRAFGTLSAEHRAVITLFAVEGLSHKEIAETLGVPLGTAWSRLHSARTRLSEALGETA